MKPKFFPIIFGLALFAAAADAAGAPTFPKTGKTYRLTIPNDVDLQSHPLAKILDDGGGGWFFVEYSVVENVDGKNQLVPYRMWLNFARVAAAAEVTNENAESPPKVRIPSSKP
jgi:hypothetical protein